MTPTDSTSKPPPDPNLLALARTRQALRLVCAEMPHLAGLANLVRVRPTRFFTVAAVGASGLLCINPDLFARIPLADVTFVLAHELLHLALDTHRRQGSADPYLVNVAHDYIINDMLGEEMGRGVPLGGLVRSGARHESLEALLVALAQGRGQGPAGCWSTGKPRRKHRRSLPGKSPISEALEKAGLVPPQEPPPPEPYLGGKTPRGDLLSAAQEAALEPEITPEQRRQLRQQIRKAAAKALGLGALRARIDQTQSEAAPPADPQRGEALMKAIHTAYQPPWQLALQRWLDAVAPGARSYARASRRGADRDDLVLCGRVREGWALHMVLDTSGSMADILPNVLGTVASFCDGAGVAQVHILQCDVEVTRDEWLEPAQLSEYLIAGFGGSDMSPAMNRLAEDSEVSAVLVLTDGYITYPTAEPPYTVLWAIVCNSDGYAATFSPPYGEVLFVDP